MKQRTLNHLSNSLGTDCVLKLHISYYCFNYLKYNFLLLKIRSPCIITYETICNSVKSFNWDKHSFVYCFKKLEGITEEDAIREPHSLDSLIFMVQEVRYFLGDRINVVEARLDCLEASNKKREI